MKVIKGEISQTRKEKNETSRKLPQSLDTPPLLNPVATPYDWVKTPPDSEQRKGHGKEFVHSWSKVSFTQPPARSGGFVSPKPGPACPATEGLGN